MTSIRRHCECTVRREGGCSPPRSPTRSASRRASAKPSFAPCRHRLLTIIASGVP